MHFNPDSHEFAKAQGKALAYYEMLQPEFTDQIVKHMEEQCKKNTTP